MRRSLYSVHPGVAMVQHAIATLPERTGRSLDEWIRVIKARGSSDVHAVRDWLKAEYKLGAT